jgi:hypothetical protein
MINPSCGLEQYLKNFSSLVGVLVEHNVEQVERVDCKLSGPDRA